jgi:hypothetical protein
VTQADSYSPPSTHFSQLPADYDMSQERKMPRWRLIARKSKLLTLPALENEAFPDINRFPGRINLIFHPFLENTLKN